MFSTFYNFAYIYDIKLRRNERCLLNNIFFDFSIKFMPFSGFYRKKDCPFHHNWLFNRFEQRVPLESKSTGCKLVGQYSEALFSVTLQFFLTDIQQMAFAVWNYCESTKRKLSSQSSIV